MANPNKPSGFSPVKYLNGADWDGRGNMYYVDSTSVSAIWPGDAVKLVAGLDQKRGIQAIDLAAAGNTLVGVVLAIGANPDGGPYIDPTNLGLTNAPATKTKSYYALVADDPMTIFEAQENSNPSALTFTAASKNINFVVAAPSAGVFISGSQLDSNTVQTTATLPFKILGLVRRADNAFGNQAKWLVKINNHAYGTGTGTVGV